MNDPLNLSPKSKQIQDMFDKISNRYDFLNRLLSFGQDLRWRSALIKKIPFEQGHDGVLYDVACGTGDVLYSFLKKRDDYKSLVGFDISEGMLKQANSRHRSPLITYVLASAEKLPAKEESAHSVTIAFGLRNVDNREAALKEFHRVLKKQGTLIVLDFFPIQNSLFKNVFDFYFKKILPTVGGLISDKEAYRYLPESVSSMPTAEEFAVLLTKCGFGQIETTSWLSGSTMLFKCNRIN